MMAWNLPTRGPMTLPMQGAVCTGYADVMRDGIVVSTRCHYGTDRGKKSCALLDTQAR